MFEFLCLKYLKDILTSRRYIPNSAKIELAELIEGVLELEGKKSVEEVNNILIPNPIIRSANRRHCRVV